MMPAARAWGVLTRLADELHSSDPIQPRARVVNASSHLHELPVISVIVMGGVLLHLEGIARLLAESRRVRVVGTATRTEDGLGRIRELCPDVALVDLPTRDLCSLALHLDHAAPQVKLVALVASAAEGEIVTRAAAGIQGYGTHETSVDQIVKIIERAAVNRRNGHAATPPSEIAWDALTKRERQILTMVGEGLTNKEIARRLQIELPTVKSHIHNILEKLRVGSRTEAAARVLWQRVEAGPDRV